MRKRETTATKSSEVNAVSGSSEGNEAAEVKRHRKRVQRRAAKLKAEADAKLPQKLSPTPSHRLWGFAAFVIVLSASAGGLVVWQEHVESARMRLDEYLEPFTRDMNIPQLNTTMLNEHVTYVKDYFAPEDVRPGKDLRIEGYVPKHPIIIVPGFVTSGLELWQGKDCSDGNFRNKIWGSANMGLQFTLHTNCWLEHLSLDPETGMDPPGIKLRAALGLEAVDYFVPGYLVWAKLIEALGDMGYDSNMLATETYDWRLSTPNMEKRDAYFTRLRVRIELTHSIGGIKVVVVSHSWGDNVFRNFLHWVEQDDPDWAEKHIHAYANIAGPVLGVPKSISALLSGESRDTADLGWISRILSDRFIPRKARTSLFRSWGSSIGMLPVGGPGIWGNHTWSPEDTPKMQKDGVSYGPMIIYREVDEEATERENNASIISRVHSLIPKYMGGPSDQGLHLLTNETVMLNVDETMELLIEAGGPNFKKHVQSWGAIHADPCSERGDKGSAKRYFFNPLKCPLPKAPSLAIYCMYGVGSPVERSFRYLKMTTPKAKEQAKSHPEDVDNEKTGWTINRDEHTPDTGVDTGILVSDGDGTVPLISTGLMCKHPQGWRGKRLNPHGVRIASREYQHEPTAAFKGYRGGPKASTHVEILANALLMTDILKIAAGEVLDDSIISDIDGLAARIDLEADLRTDEPATC
ncbi:hypothetical protein WJX84_008799 [Apatococcus fuscideae]|uniref:Phospholipid:diacylglycerol acyltransferase n=1 Tax=Apatococcus fuscideae TaxID=2026836 RepID=A0AAW1S058_9CHLO